MESTPSAPSRVSRVLRFVAAIVLTSTGLGFGALAFRSARKVESVTQDAPVDAITDPADLKMRQRDIVGTFATGDRRGDRVIAVNADGTIQFSQIDAKGRTSPEVDTYRLGRRNRNSCLATARSGTVEMIDIDTAEYFRDRSHRIK